jgi:hypothetical protein
MHLVIRKMMLKHAPNLARRIEDPELDLAMVVTCPVHGVNAQVHVRASLSPGGDIMPTSCSLLGGKGEKVSCQRGCVRLDRVDNPEPTPSDA